MKTPTKIALLSVDNTRTFEDKSLNELYVQGGEEVAVMTHAIMAEIKQMGGLLYNVLEKHPQGHLSFASNYKEYSPFSNLFVTEVAHRTPEHHAINTKTAGFTLDQLNDWLKVNNIQELWPDHSVEGTAGVELMPPLSEDQFDRTIVKGTVAREEEYSGFSNGQLDAQLKEDGVDTVVITGVATDYCVVNTALDAKKNGYNTLVVMDAIKGVGLRSSYNALQTMRESNIELVFKEELIACLVGKFNADIPLSL